MSKNWPKVFRDPVHDLIVFEDSPWDRLLLELINTSEVQRLRRIKQLGFSELVFPAANHSRFAHSLGVLHVAKRFLDRCEKILGAALAEEDRTLILVATLLHDIGHGPFSHAFEKVTGRKHERYTLDIIQDPGTEVSQTLRKFSQEMPQKLAGFFSKDPKTTLDVPPFLAHIVSSQLDADRCDYLLRDSHATGTNYGEYDLSWLLAQLRVQSDRKRFYLSRKALSATEAYLFARSHMYRTVYFHKTTRAAEVMLRLLFQRFKQLLQTEPRTKDFDIVLQRIPRNLVSAFDSSGQISVLEYSKIDDHSITEFMKACSGSSDSDLQRLSWGLLNRHLFKAIEATSVIQAAEVDKIAEFDRTVLSYLQEKKLDPHLHFANDMPGDTPYKPYNPDDQIPETQIYVENGAGQPVEVGTLSDTVIQLRKKYVLVRYYFSPEHQAEISAIAQKTLWRPS